MLSAGIIGGSGFVGSELMRLLAVHPQIDVGFVSAATHAGAKVGEHNPGLALSYPELVYEPWEAVPPGLDLVFVALPHGESQAVIPKLDASRILDLGADFRLRDPAVFSEWYGLSHTAPELLPDFVFGLPELFRSSIAGARYVAMPGCYVTTAVLALAPLLANGLIESGGIVVDAASGVSGAGRAPKPGTTFSTVDGSFTAYGLLDHRHTPEMQQALSDHAGQPVELLFTPHLAPMSRGILATCYGRATGPETSSDLMAAVADAYRDEPFVYVSETIPSTKATLGSNSFHLTVRRDQRTGWVVAIGALDNLVKGAAGQAVQAANLMMGINETTGLAQAGVFP